MTGGQDLADAVSEYGDAAKRKLASKAASGGKEAQLAGPIEALIKTLAELSGIPAGAITLVLEANLSDLRLRPDFAVDVHNALIGFIELKAPERAPTRATSRTIMTRSNG